VRSRGWAAALEGPPDAASAGPLGALARGLLGTFQVNVGSAGTTMSGAIDGDLRNDVVSVLQQETTRQRASTNEFLASTVNALGETRRLRAVRNLDAGRAVNLALFSVARQWLVSTVEGATRPVVLIKVHELDRDFTHEDVFVHRRVLRARLLEPELADAIEAVATAYAAPVPAAPEPKPAARHAKQLTGRLVIADPASGKGSVIKITALLDGRERSVEIRAADEDTTVDFTLDLGGAPLDELHGWRFEFIKRSRWSLDENARFTPTELEIELTEDGTEAVPVRIPGQVHVWPGMPPRTFAPGLERARAKAAPAPPDASSSRDLLRVLAHLDANRPYYRLMIDLDTDPVTRFTRLAERKPAVPMPADLQPVGVAGAHLAFLAAEDGTAPGKTEPPIRTVLATPAGGTFVEVLPGATAIAPATPKTGWPTVAVPKDFSLLWPAPVQLAAVERDTSADDAGDGVEAKEPAAVPDASLPAKLTELFELTQTIKASVDALEAKVPTGPAPATGGEAGDGEKGGGATPAAGED
jgi:hypothetical protein